MTESPNVVVDVKMDERTGIVTAAEMIRRQQRQHEQQHELSTVSTTTTATKTKSVANTQSSVNSNNSNHSIDIDDEIQRLERELQNFDDDDDDDVVDEDDNEEESIHNKGDTMGMIVSLSESKQSPIEQLPTHCLPAVPTTSTKSKRTKSNKKRSRTDNDDGTTTTNDNPVVVSGDGLKKAVQELLQNYQGRANTERIPFYCRYCHYQGIDYHDFMHHQNTSTTHVQNVTIHKKATYCSLCRKQFNSPIQLQEHVSSKPHVQKLQLVQSKQQRKTPSSKIQRYNNNTGSK